MNVDAAGWDSLDRTTNSQSIPLCEDENEKVDDTSHLQHDTLRMKLDQVTAESTRMDREFSSFLQSTRRIFCSVEEVHRDIVSFSRQFSSSADVEDIPCSEVYILCLSVCLSPFLCIFLYF